MIYEKINLRDKEIGGFMPTLTTYIIDDPMELNRKRGAVLICPGGGYKHFSLRESEPIALKFISAGYHAFVLNYCVAPNRYPEGLKDASNAMVLIRERSEEWNIDADKIAICGFSAGGHLAASLCTFFDDKDLGTSGGLNKPNALILSYPVITSGKFAHRGSFENLLGDNADKAMIEKMSLENQINSKIPPVFLWHTYTDNSVPVENSLMYAMSLKKYGIPLEMHIFPSGGHGLSLATKEVAKNDDGVYPNVAVWIDLAVTWLDNLFAECLLD